MTHVEINIPDDAPVLEKRIAALFQVNVRQYHTTAFVAFVLGEPVGDTGRALRSLELQDVLFHTRHTKDSGSKITFWSHVSTRNLTARSN